MNSVLFISLMNTDSWGGSEVQWLSLAEYCIENNISVTCLVYEWEKKKSKLTKLSRLGANIIYIPNAGRKKENIFDRLRFEWITRIEQRIFIRQFDFSKYDFVVVNQGGFMEVTYHPWKNVYPKFNKYCLTFHNYTVDYQFKKDKAHILKNWMDNAYINIGDAAKIGTVLEKQLSTSFKNFTSLVNPLTITRCEGLTPFTELLNGNYKVVMIAQLDISRKAQDNLIQAFALPQWKDRNVIVELYGGGEHFDLLEKMIRENNLSKKVFLKGNTNIVSEVLDTSHLVLQITHRDAMPISVVEAMSKSRAVVVSNVGDMPLWVNEGENGWVAPDASVQSIATVLEKAWEKRNDWEQMGVNAFKTFLKKYPTSVAEEFYKIISQ